VGKILIVDDNEMIRLTFSEILQMEGYETQTAANGLEAIKWLEIRSFDLIITDILMPDMDGFELMAKLKERGEDIALIGISGGGDVPSGVYLKVASQMGSIKTLTKPVLREDLLATVAEALGSELKA
jgi:DNA-binding NtrC family response regulator